MKTVTILGKEYPIEYTVEAQSKFAEKGGGLKKIAETLSMYPSFALSVMMEAAYHRKKVLAKMDGVECDIAEPLSESDIDAVLMPHEMVGITKTMMDVMSEAYKADVETAPEKKTGKKTKATLSE